MQTRLSLQQRLTLTHIWLLQRHTLIHLSLHQRRTLIHLSLHPRHSLTTAKAYTDSSLVTAKAYTDTSLVTAKAYTDTAIASSSTSLFPTKVSAFYDPTGGIPTSGTTYPLVASATKNGWVIGYAYTWNTSLGLWAAIAPSEGDHFLLISTGREWVRYNSTWSLFSTVLNTTWCLEE